MSAGVSRGRDRLAGHRPGTGGLAWLPAEGKNAAVEDGGTPVTMTYPCVCCGHLTLDEPPGSFDICPVCFWEDDAVQLRWPDWPGGANRPCLIEGQRTYRQLGACEERLLPHVRSATDAESPAPNWRPINPDRDRFEPRGVALAPWPGDLTALYWWRYRDPAVWRRAD
jgi:hypothetical protein